jgi:beta-glucosidase
MVIDRRDLASFDDSQSKWIGDAGTYTFKVGDNVEDIKGSCTLSLKAYEEKVTNVLAPQQPLTLLKQNKK